MNFSALTDFLVQQLHTHIRTYSSEKKFTKLLTRRIDLKDIFLMTPEYSLIYSITFLMKLLL